jgi:hypothetical protein
MKAWIVRCGKRVMGRLLARSEDEALVRAKEFWGRSNEYTIKPVKKSKGEP